MRGDGILLAALALIPDAACQRGRQASARPDAAPAHEVVSIERVAVSFAVWPEGAGSPPDARVVSGRVWEELAQVPHLELARRPGGEALPDAAPGTVRRRARVNVEVAVERAGAETLRAVATVAILWTDDIEEHAPWSSHGCEGPSGADADLAQRAVGLTDCAVGDAARGVAEKEVVRRGEPAKIIDALSSPDATLRQVAFAAIAERRLRQAVPRLLELLKSDDELVRDGAIGALVALREPRAIKALTELAQFSDIDMMRRVIDAVGAIGGEDARAYLELVASGHELPVVRELAEGALARLARRGDAGT